MRGLRLRPAAACARDSRGRLPFERPPPQPWLIVSPPPRADDRARTRRLVPTDRPSPPSHTTLRQDCRNSPRGALHAEEYEPHVRLRPYQGHEEGFFACA